MPDWNAIRSAAQRWHRKLLTHLPDCFSSLPTADALLAAAALETDVEAYPMPSDDPLLAGAHAVLDRSVPGIWYADLPDNRPLSRFARAHEYAHFWLHPELTNDICAVNDLPEDYVEGGQGIAAGQVAEGYGPAERREREANVFAAELLLPAPTVRRLFIDEGWTATRLSAHVGVAEACVLAQLASALLQTPQPGHEDDPATLQPSPPLDRSQSEAAYARQGPLLVDAGPGTGKTRTLIARLAWLLETKQAGPENILALTFSNQAADEMRIRLRSAVGAVAERVWIGTFHAFGFEILRKDAGRLGLPASPALIDLSDAVTLLEQNLDRLTLDEYEYLFRPALPFPDILSCISAAKDEMLGPQAYLELAQAELAAAGTDEKKIRTARRSIEIGGIYRVYEQLLVEQGLLDFGDLIRRAVELLDSCPDVRARWQTHFRHVVADEYQDVNRACAQLLRRITGSGQGFWAVGDLRQAIYRFRGASPANIRDFEQDFPSGRRLRLQHNYRSAPDVVSMANGFAAVMPNADPEEPWRPERTGAHEPAIMVAVAEDEVAQVDGLASQIRREQEKGIPLHAQAILCRTNRQAADFAEALEARGIPSLNLGGLFEREEIRDLLSILSIASKPEGLALARVARLYDISKDDVIRLLNAAKEHTVSFPQALELGCTLDGLTADGRAGLIRLVGHLRPILHRGDAWYFLCRYLFDSSDYIVPIVHDQTPAGAQRRTAILQLLQVIQKLSRKLQAENSPCPRAAVLDNLRHRLICGQDRLAPRISPSDTTEAVRIMTIHQSKGLEFPVVYLPDLAAGQFPPRKAARMAAVPPGLSAPIGIDDAVLEQENEACLFFVALTRARDQLVLSRPAARKGSAIGPCKLFEMLEPVLDPNRLTRVTWTRNEPAIREPSAHAECSPNRTDPYTPISLEAPSAQALEQYQLCPRRFYYRSVLRLPEADGDTPYLTLHRCLTATQEWAQSEIERGTTPTEEAIEGRFDEEWKRESPNQTAYARLLRNRGAQLLQNMRKTVDRNPAGARRTMIARLDAGSVRVTADQVEDVPDGPLRLIDVRTGRPDADDHTAPRLALMRYAAQHLGDNRPIEIVLDYMSSGERKVVRETPRWEPARIEKYNSALRAISEGKFDPDPEPRKCAQCPYFLVCPT